MPDWSFRFSSFVTIFISCFLVVHGMSYESRDDSRNEVWKSIKDPRSDGIAYEADRAVCAYYLKEVSPSMKLEDFSKPGHHVLRIKSHESSEAIGAEKVLHCILNAGIDDDSTWDFEISESYNYGRPKLNITLVAQFFRAAPVVNQIRWNSPSQIPVKLFQLIESRHPTAKLYYSSLFTFDRYGYQEEHDEIDERSQLSIYASSSDTQDTTLSREDKDRMRAEKWKKQKEKRRENREAMINSTTLYNLQAHVSYGGESETERMDLVHRLLITCPNIRELCLSVVWRGCIATYEPQPYGFNFELHNETIAPLESLTLRGYTFEGKPDGLEWMEWEVEKPQRNILNFPWNRLPASIVDYFGYPQIKEWGGLQEHFVKRTESKLKEGERTNLDYWLERMDWSKLKTLKLEDPRAYELGKFSGDVLSGLRSVEFGGGDRKEIARFLNNITASLDSISIRSGCVRSPDDILDAAFTKHSKTLKSLALRHKDRFDSEEFYTYSYSDRKPFQYPPNTFLNHTHLSQLLQNCPSMEALDIDLYIDGEWDYDVLDALARFENLKRLNLMIENFAGDTEKETRFQQRIWKDDGAWMGKLGIEGYLRKVKKGVEFEKVEVTFGVTFGSQDSNYLY